MIRILIGLIVLVFIGALLRLAWLRARGNVRAFVLATAIAGVLALLLLLVATGRLHWLFTIPAVLLPFGARILRLLPWLGLLRRAGPTPFGRGGAGSGTGGSTSGTSSTSRVETASLRMELDQASGELRGEVLRGPHAGRSLADIGLPALLELLAAWRRDDPEAARLLETWLERAHGSDWRDQETPASSGNGDPSRAEALAILGLSGDPDRDTIKAAHRRLMQQMHPDHGGSDHLAAQINRAKDRLLADLEGH